MASKLGYHIERRDESYMLSQHLAGHVVKVIDYPDNRNLWPGKLVIAREALEGSFEDWAVQQGAHGAELWWAKVGKKLLTAPYAYIEVLNEPWAGSIHRCKQIAAFTKRAVEILHDNGLKACVLNMAEGNPPANSAQEWEERVSILLESVVGADLFGLHGYWLPTTLDHPEAGITPYHALPHERWYAVASKHGISIPDCVLTEAGCDLGVGHYKPGLGWRDGYQSFADYMKDIALFDARLMSHPRVLGACLFTLGPNARWVSFGLGQNEVAILNDYIARQGGPFVPGAPVDPVDPTPEPGDIDWQVRQMLEEALVSAQTTQEHLLKTLALLEK